MDIQTGLKSFFNLRSSHPGLEFGCGRTGITMLEELADSILDSGKSETWRRRPAISHDGTPFILSCKLGSGVGDAIRLLVEPGSYRLTVAQQIAFSLRRLDSMLGQLNWRNAVPGINAITSAVFPPDAGDTANWWGGIWLGANVPLYTVPRAESDLRLYLNLRHGSAASRWNTLASIVSNFVSPSLGPAVETWMALVSRHAIPVGIGVVVAADQIRAIRAYVGVYEPSLESLLVSTAVFRTTSSRELAAAHDAYRARFGELKPQSVTIGYDFSRGMSASDATTHGRVKIDML